MMSNINFIIPIIATMFSLFALVINTNLIKKLLAMSVFQTTILIIYISMAKIHNSKIPVLDCLDFKECPQLYTNPLPHVLMLTAIVVGVATLAVGLSIIIKIKDNFDSIDENDITG